MESEWVLWVVLLMMWSFCGVFPLAACGTDEGSLGHPLLDMLLWPVVVWRSLRGEP